TRSDCLGNAEFIAGMGAERVVGHELFGDLLGQRPIKPAADVDGRQFRVFPLVVCLELGAFALEVGLFGVGLRVDGHVLSGSHRHGSGDETGDAGDQYTGVSGVRGGDTEHQTGGGKDAVVGTQHGGAQPANASDVVAFLMT